jgi:hypothetical protein
VHFVFSSERAENIAISLAKRRVRALPFAVISRTTDRGHPHVEFLLLAGQRLMRTSKVMKVS